ncbi:oligosaccharide flippase family protein [Thermoflavifilum sp.]|uniref:oligosaccharide flippase family protein n=1 Tax=Thermoflavifilum sp. TaxID=1968839 RepID=UPI0025EE1EB9|nr:oligosaccharide flippase family protein [Thermoflavifilum sp.]
MRNRILYFFSNYWLRSGTLTLLQRGSVVLFGVFSYMILARIISKDEMGVWGLFLAITTTYEMIQVSLIRKALITYYHRVLNEREKEQVKSSSLVINIIFTSFFILLIILIGEYIDILFHSIGLYHLLKIYILISITLILFTHFICIQQANLSFNGSFISYAIRQGFFFIVLSIFFFLRKKNISLSSLVWIQLAAISISTIISYFHTRRYLTHRFIPNTKYIKELIGYGKYMFGTGVCSNIFGSMDRYMTASLLSSTIVAYYDLNSRINNMLSVPTMAVGDILFPKSALTMISEGTGKVRQMYERVTGILVSIIIPISMCILVFTKWIVIFLAGKSYLAAVPIIRISILFAFIKPIQNQASNILDSINKPNITFYNNLSILVVSIIMNYLCIKQFGVLGAVIASSITGVYALATSIYLLRKHTGSRLINVLYESWFTYKNAISKIKI